MVHILTVAPCSCSPVDAWNVGGCEATGSVIPARAGLLDAPAARDCSGGTGRLHNGIRSDANAHWTFNHDSDSYYRRWGYGDYNGQHHHFELGLHTVAPAGCTPAGKPSLSALTRIENVAAGVNFLCISKGGV
jgi:hypothetical protein